MYFIMSNNRTIVNGKAEDKLDVFEAVQQTEPEVYAVDGDDIGFPINATKKKVVKEPELTVDPDTSIDWTAPEYVKDAENFGDKLLFMDVRPETYNSVAKVLYQRRLKEKYTFEQVLGFVVKYANKPFSPIEPDNTFDWDAEQHAKALVHIQEQVTSLWVYRNTPVLGLRKILLAKQLSLYLTRGCRHSLSQELTEVLEKHTGLSSNTQDGIDIVTQAYNVAKVFMEKGILLPSKYTPQVMLAGINREFEKIPVDYKEEVDYIEWSDEEHKEMALLLAGLRDEAEDKTPDEWAIAAMANLNSELISKYTFEQISDFYASLYSVQMPPLDQFKTNREVLLEAMDEIIAELAVNDELQKVFSVFKERFGWVLTDKLELKGFRLDLEQ